MFKTAFKTALRHTSFAALFSVTALPALAADVVGFDLDVFENLLRGFGSVERDVDGEGDPMFSGRMEGMKYSLYFYDCEAPGGCNNGIFTAFFDGSDYNTDLTRVNAFNSEHRFGKVSVDDDGDLELNMTFVFKGGTTREALDDTFDWWRVVMGQAEEFFE